MKIYIFLIILVAMVHRTIAEEEDSAPEVLEIEQNNNSGDDYEDYEEDFSSVSCCCKGVFHYGQNRSKTYVTTYFLHCQEK